MKSNKSLIIGICILFIFAFIILIDKQEEEKLGDIRSGYFNITSIPNKRMVARDMEAIYPRYYVVYFDNNDYSYIIHSFNYYETESQYELEFNRLKDKIAYYNKDELMIRYVYKKGFANYNEMLEDLKDITGSNNLEIYS